MGFYGKKYRRSLPRMSSRSELAIIAKKQPTKRLDSVNDSPEWAYLQNRYEHRAAE
jgi:hypothetical protein